MFHSVQEVAQLLRLSESTVLRLIREGEIIAVRLGRQYRIHEGTIEAIKSSGLIREGEK